jgi:hypothetical protein
MFSDVAGRQQGVNFAILMDVHGGYRYLNKVYLVLIFIVCRSEISIYFCGLFVVKYHQPCW